LAKTVLGVFDSVDKAKGSDDLRQKGFSKNEISSSPRKTARDEAKEIVTAIP
jgi:hypothetical protein